MNFRQSGKRRTSGSLVHAMVRLAQDAATSPDVRSLCQGLARQMLATFRAGGARVMLLDAETGRLETQAWAGRAAELSGAAGLPGEAQGMPRAADRALYFDDLRASPAFPGKEEMVGAAVRSLLRVPLIHRGKALGIVDLLDPQRGSAGRRPGSDERTVAFAAHAAALIANARRLESSQRSTAERALYEVERRCRHLAEHAQEVVFRYALAPTRRFDYVSPAAEEITGYTVEELRADPDLLAHLLDPEDRPLLQALLRCPHRAPQPMLLRWRHKDGDLIWIEQHTLPVYDEAGALAAIEVVARDITERKRVEDLLRESEARYRALVERIPAVTYIAAVEGHPKAHYISPQIEGILGYGPEECCQRSLLWDQIHPEDRDRVLAALTQDPEAGEILVQEYRLRARDGRTVWVRDEAIVTSHEMGAPLMLRGVIFDITEKKLLEERQLASYRIIAAMNETTSVQEMFRAVHREVSRILPAENFYVAYHDAEQDAMVFPYFVDEHYPERGNTAVAVLSGRGLTDYVMRTGEPLLLHEEDVLALAARGEVDLGVSGPMARVWLGVPLRSEGRTLGVMALQSYHDREQYTAEHLQWLDMLSGQVAAVFERKRIEQSLRESEERFRLLSACAPIAIYLMDAQGRCIYANDGWASLMGRSAEDALGDGWRETVHPEDRPRTFATWAETVRSGKNWAGEIRLVTPTGVRWASVRGVPMHSEQGEGLGFIGTMEDITERKRSEQALRFLTEATEVLSSSLDYEATLARVAELSVPAIADWCVVFMGSEDGRLRRVAVAHADPKKAELAESFRRLPPLSPGDGWSPAAQVFDSGRSLLLADVAGEWPSTAGLSGERQKMFDTIAPRSMMVVPLAAGGRVLGTLSLIASESGRRFDQADLSLAEELGRRGGMAVENARLYHAAQEEIESRRRAEEALSASERRWRALTEYASDTVALFSADGTYLYVSPSTRRHSGYAPEELVGTSVFGHAHPEDAERLRRMLPTILAIPGGVFSMEFRMRHKDGTWRFVEATGTNRLNDPDVNALVVNARDITDRRLAEQEQQRLLHQLEEKQAYLEAVLQQMPVAVNIFDAAGNIIHWNARAAAITGTPTPPAGNIGERAQLVGFHPDGRPLEPDEWPAARALLEGETVHDAIIDMPDGAGGIQRTRGGATPVRDQNGQIIAVVAIFDRLEPPPA